MKTRVGTPTEFTQIVTATDCYYVAAPASGRGFAIIAADDAVASPVGAYSPDAPFPTDTADMPPQMEKRWSS